MTTLAVAGLLAPAGAAAGAPPYAAATGSAFLPGLPPAAHPPTVCLVDTGVTPGPLTGDVLRISMTGDDPSDGAPGGHGTILAGIVRELLPSATLQSARVVAADGSIGWDDVARGIRACARDDAPGPHVITVAVSASGDWAASPVQEAVQVARTRGMSVIISAGNEGGTPTGFAAVPGAVPVAAVTSSGAACPFTARAEGLLAAPACPIHAAGLDGGRRPVQGTSFAVPQVAASLAALRAHRPDLTADQAENLLVAAAVRTPDGLRRLETTEAFRRAGLGTLVPPQSTIAGTPTIVVRRVIRRQRHVIVLLRIPPRGWRPVARGAAARVLSRGRIVVARLTRARTIRIALVGAAGRRTKWRAITVPAAPDRR